VESGAYPLREGNLVRPLVDGEPAFRRICQAVEAARSSVWVTVAFIRRDVQMPDGRGSFFDVLDRAASRGLDVRVLFWREHVEPQSLDVPAGTFSGSEEERDWLRERGSSFLARWDILPGGYCHHQKSWIVDAGGPGEVGFIGGINLQPASVVPPGHPPSDGGNTHDIYLEVRGPATTDVHHNFVQRWNEASERGLEDGSWPEGGPPNDLPFPVTPSPTAGKVPVQITRTVRSGLYANDIATPGGKPFPIADGEGSILDQYIAAIDAARRSIYIENQAIGSPQVVDRLETALQRGVEIVFLVPGQAPAEFQAAKADPRAAPFLEKIAGLGSHNNFTLAGIAGSREPGRYEEIYAHVKAALVDDAWATIGSTNIANRSFYRDTELNASFWHQETVRALRVELLQEHLGLDTAGVDDRGALQLYRDVAHANRARRASGEPMSGLAYAIDPAEYAK
jgi:phosphatidylserine/phosphatidylglycerophosphate/cardiolipin synthase-like enzyme